MDQERAEQLAAILDGETWDSGGDIWLVLKKRTDGRIVVFSDELVAVYSDIDAVQGGKPEENILLV